MKKCNMGEKTFLSFICANYFHRINVCQTKSVYFYQNNNTLISRDSRYVSAPLLFCVILCLLPSFIFFVPRYHVISGIGSASRIHSRIKLSPSCFMVGFFGNLGVFPFGILGNKLKYINDIF